MWIQERSSSRVFALGGVEKGGGEGEEGGEERSFSSFCKKSLLHRLSHLRSREKILQAVLSLSLSLGSTPDITLFVEFLLLREVFYFYVLSFMNGISTLCTQTLFQL